MTVEEFETWAEYYRKWPFDEATRYHRPAAVITAAALRSREPIDKLQEMICPVWRESTKAEDERLADLSADDMALLAMLGIGGN